MHKAKGKEFDRVFILLRDYQMATEEKKRVLYVAMTRAKHHLSIHTNNIKFDSTDIENLDYRLDENQYVYPKKIIFQAGLGDVNLGFFRNAKTIQNVASIHAGSELAPLSNGKTSYLKSMLLEDAGVEDCVVRFSQQFKDNIYAWSGYTIRSAIARYMVRWYCKEDGQVYTVVLPRIVVGR